MNSIMDNISEGFQTVSISRLKHNSLIIAEKERNDLFDLITNRVEEEKGLSYDDLKLIYDMQIKNPVYEISEEEEKEDE